MRPRASTRATVSCQHTAMQLLALTTRTGNIVEPSYPATVLPDTAHVRFRG
jgi:hypothetical protein